MVAACWSPAMPRMRDRAAEQSGIGRAEVGGTVLHLRQHRARHAKIAAARRPSCRCGCRAAACARRWWRRWRATLPPVSRQSRKLSTVPKQQLAALGAPRAPARDRGSRRSWCRRNRDRGSARSWLVIIGSCRRLERLAQMSAVRRSCQTMARWIGLPVSRSQTSVVSRWLVMPIAAMSPALTPALAIASRRSTTRRARCPRGRARPSRRPGKCCGEFLLRHRDWMQIVAEHDGPRRSEVKRTGVPDDPRSHESEP